MVLLAKGIGQNLYNLEKLSIAFNWCYGLRGTGVKEFSKAISSSCKNMNKLSLSFIG